MIEMGALQ